MRTRIPMQETKSIYKAFDKYGYVSFNSLGDKYFMIHYPQKFSAYALRNLQEADYIIVCHPANFVREFPQYKEKTIGNWIKKTVVTFYPEEISIRESGDRLMKEKMLVLKTPTTVEVIDKDVYKKRYSGGDKVFPGKVDFLYQNEELLIKRSGTFTSFFNVFTDTGKYIKLSWTGETNSIIIPVSEKITHHRVKNAFLSTGLSLEDFIRALDKLHRNGEI